MAKFPIHHFHSKVLNKGRYFIEGPDQSGQYLIAGSKHMISSEINKCITFQMYYTEKNVDGNDWRACQITK